MVNWKFGCSVCLLRLLRTLKLSDLCGHNDFGLDLNVCVSHVDCSAVMSATRLSARTCIRERYSGRLAL